MSLKQHASLDERFRQQYLNAGDYLLPFLAQVMPIVPGMRVLEIGAAEGGVLKPFCEGGCFCTGVDLSEGRIEVARRMMAAEIAASQAEFIAQNVYDADFQQKYDGAFDLILLKDTIEHIPDQERFMPYITRFLRPGGAIFFGFPPWRMPFGGHQQICRSKLLGMWPWLHLLPAPLYRGILRAFGERDAIVQELMEIKATGISTLRFERILRYSGLQTAARRFYFINPIYRFKFGLAPRVQWPWVASLGWFRDFFTTAAWYIVKPTAAPNQPKP